MTIESHGQLKPGDRVTVRGMVSCSYPDGSIRVNVTAIPSTTSTVSFSIRPDQIATHEPRAIAVGDWVNAGFDDEKLAWKVLAIDGEMAWLGRRQSSWRTQRIDQLTRCRGPDWAPPFNGDPAP
jgi:hypothetical protein